MRRLPSFAAGLLCLAGLSHAIEKRDGEAALARIQRVYVEKLGGGESSEQMRDILITSLQNSGLFLVTENQERADAVIRGSSEDVTFTEEHHTSDTLGAHNQLGSSQSARTGKAYLGTGLTANETSSSKERKHEATASVRIIGANGDVLWSTTQESGGARFHGAMADVADKIVRKLMEDMQKARKNSTPSPGKAESEPKN